MFNLFLYSETYEYVYGKNRQRGHALLAHYCHQKVHLKAPKPESLRGPLPLGPNLVLPPLLLPVEAKPKVRSKIAHQNNHNEILQKHCGEGNSTRYSPPRVLIPSAFLRRW